MRDLSARPPAASDPTEGDQRPALRVRPLPAEPVRVHIMGAESLDILNARDISATGVGVYVAHRFAGCDLAAEVELVIALPRRRSFLARGVIKHLTRGDEPSDYFGVEFTSLRDENAAQIRAYVEELGAS